MEQLTFFYRLSRLSAAGYSPVCGAMVLFALASLAMVPSVSYARQDTILQDSSHIYHQQSMMPGSGMMAPMSLPALPDISYDIPSVLTKGQPASFLPVNTGGAVYADGDVVTYAGTGSVGYLNGSVENALFNAPGRMTWDASGNIVLCDVNNHRIRKISPSGTVSTFAGSGTAASINGTGESASFAAPYAIAIDGTGNMYINDRATHVVRKVTPGGVVTTLAGQVGVRGYANGTGTAAKFDAPSGIEVDASGNVYVVDEGNRRVRKITPSGVVTTFVGSGSATSVNGTGTAAGFHGIKGIARDAAGNFYVAEYNGAKIRKITPSGVVTTFAGSGVAATLDGTGTSARFYFPISLKFDGAGNLYVTQLDNRIRKITPSGIVTTIAGSGQAGMVNGSPLSAKFNLVLGILIDPSGNIYFADTDNHYIRKMGNGVGYSISPALPAGLSFNKTTGEISGTPTAVASSQTYTIKAYNAAGSDSFVVTFAVVNPPPPPYAPSRDQNYIIESTVRDGNITAISQLDTLSSVESVNRNIQYFDGLGRPVETVHWHSSPHKRDVVQVTGYDSFGREDMVSLPYSVSSNGSYLGGDVFNAYDFYIVPYIEDIVRTDYFYSRPVYEQSPRSRVVEQGTPGAAWQPSDAYIAGSGHTVRTDYGFNEADDVASWGAGSGGASSVGYYPAGTLYRTTLKDENWESGKSGTVDEYKDVDGKVMLRRVWKNETETLDTYYLYDDFDQLLYVVPPGYTANTIDTGSTTFKELVYAYNYDNYGRLVEKKLPGKGWEWIVYNRNDRPILTQDAVQREQGEWSYTKYDMYSRVTETGIYTNHYADQARAQAALDSLLALNGGIRWETYLDSTYSNLTFPDASLQPLVVNYYDGYGFAGAYRLPEKDIVKSSKVKRLPTGTKIYKDDGTSPLLTVNYYDDKGRVIQTAAQNHLGGTDYVTNTYSFMGELLTSRRVHKVAADSTVIFTKNEYDHVGRLLAVKQKINGQDTVILARNEYNEIGQLSKKLIGGNQEGTVFHDAVTYAYNERGWLISADATNFSYGLNYNEPTGGAAAQYNGNISEQHWTKDGQSAKYFTYAYDKLNRLTDGNSTTGNMREELAYDDRGNIVNLRRDNHSTGTTYTYTGNRLKSLTGEINTTQDYTYDGNGNALTDRTGMSFSYNYLNLPDSAWNGTVNVGYLYDALGTKLRKYSNQGGNRDYVGGIEYNSTGAIDIIHTGEGVAYRNSNGTYTYRYNLSDHLGNVRATIYRNPVTDEVEVLQSDDYYPFGKQYVVSAGDNRYLYNGKELQGELGGQYDYGARFYDAEIGRWNVVDPLAEQMRRHSPYNYAFNNPIRFIDPDGMAPMSDGDKAFLQGLIAWANTVSAMEDQEDPPQDPPVKGYWNSFRQATNDYAPFDRAGKTFTRWLGEGPGAMLDDLGGVAGNLTYGVGSLFFGETYVNGYNNFKNYINATPEERGAADGTAAAAMIEGAVTYAPLSYLQFNTSFLKYAGPTFSEYKAMHGGTETLGWIPTSTGAQRISTEFSHMFITQRMQRRLGGGYNWLVNNRLNIWKINTIQHSIIDKYRFNFLRRGMKGDVGFSKKYHWFYNDFKK